ncbi:MAG: hypothetical protein HRF43_04030 [Phycisphaerae bacterium]|jgi:hypothetical protein
MPRERNAFKLGLALISFFVLFVAVLVFLAPRGGGDLPLVVRYPHDEFTTVLKAGGEVACGGKTVGTITGVDLREMESGSGGPRKLFVLVGIKVDSALALRKDCRIMPEELILGGPGKLVIADRGLGQPLEPGEMIDGAAGASVASLSRLLAAQLDARDPASLVALVRAQLDPADARSLVGKVHASMDDLNALTQAVRNEADPRQTAALVGKLHAILDNVNQTTRLLRTEADKAAGGALLSKLHDSMDALNDGLATAAAILKENRGPLHDTLEHVRGTSELLERQIAARIARQLDPSDPAALLAKVHVALDRLGGSLNDMNVITAGLRETIVLNKDQITRMLVNMKETSDHLKAASKEIRRSPWRLFYQPTQAEAQQANVLDAARAFSEAATRLDDAMARLEALGQLNAATRPADDGQLILIRDQLQQTFSNFSKAEAALWENLKIK